MQVYELPLDLQRKLFDYTNAMWNQNKGFETEAMLAHLPTSVKAEVMLHINESLIQRVPLLKQCSDRFLEAIILRMSSQVCLAGDYIFKEGDKSREMYFVRTGSVEIIMEDEHGTEAVIADIHSYSDCPFFGEISLLLGETRTASAKATSKCVLSSLSQEDFFEVLSMFPDEENSLRETASARLQNDIDREQAALQKKKEEEEEGEGEDEEDQPGTVVKKKALGSHASHGGVQRSKHETRLTALEMTTLTNAQRERGMSVVTGMGAGGGAAAAPQGDGRRPSVSKTKGAVRMHRLQGGLATHSSRLSDGESLLPADGDSSPAAGDTDLARPMPSPSPPLAAGEGGDGSAAAEEDAEMEHRIDHQKALRSQLEGPTANGGERIMIRRLSSQAIVTQREARPAALGAGMSSPGMSAGLASEELQQMRVKRDIGELREKERMMEKAQLEMEDKVRAMEADMRDMRQRLDQLTAALAPSSAAAAAGAAQGQGTGVSGLGTPSGKSLRPGFSFRAVPESPGEAPGGGGATMRSSRRKTAGAPGRGADLGMGAIAVKPNPAAGGAAVASPPQLHINPRIDGQTMTMEHPLHSAR